MGKYFGTDGFRGEAGITLTADHAYQVGRFLGWYYNALRERNGDTNPARIVIGKDTRRSSYMFEYSLVAGLTASGADAYLLHVTTTPSVAYIARVDDFDCGIMISASHNPYYDNGIKLIDCYGEKMPEEILLLVEDYIDGKLHVFDKDWPELPFAHREHIGCTVDYVAGRNRYMGYLISLGIYSFKGVKVGLDCANGSSWNIAKSVFDICAIRHSCVIADGAVAADAGKVPHRCAGANNTVGVNQSVVPYRCITVDLCSGIQQNTATNGCTVLDASVLQHHTAVSHLGIRTDIGTGSNDVGEPIAKCFCFLIHLRPELVAADAHH